MKYEHCQTSAFDIDDANLPSVREAAASCAEFVRLVPSRLEQMERLADLAWVYSRRPLDIVRPSFGTFCRWAESHDNWVLRQGDEQTSKLVVLDPTHRDVLERIEQERRAQPEWELTDTGISIVTDIGIAFAEFIRVRYPWAAWTFKDRKSDLHYGEPCVGWFNGAANSSILIGQYSFVAIARARESGKPLEREFGEIIERHAKGAEIPGARVKWVR